MASNNREDQLLGLIDRSNKKNKGNQKLIHEHQKLDRGTPNSIIFYIRTVRISNRKA